MVSTHAYGTPMIHVFRVMLLAVVLTALAHAQVADERNTLRLAQVYEQAGKHDEALRYYRDLFAAKPDNSAYFEGVRRCLLALKQYTEAVSLLGERIRRFPADEQLLVHRGGVYVLMEKVDSARADWKKAIALNPDIAPSYFDLALVRYAQKDYEESWKWMLEAKQRGYPRAVQLERLLMGHRRRGS